MGLSGVKTCLPSSDMFVTHALWTVNNVAVKFFGKLYNFNCLPCSFSLTDYFAACRAAQVTSQPYACEFCKRSEDFKGLKILLL